MRVLGNLISKVGDRVPIKKLPRRVQIEITNHCEMGCPGCGGRGGTVGFMQVEEFKEVLTKLPNSVERVEVIGRGDIFYHPDIYEILDLCGEWKRFCAATDTHGSFSELDCQRIIRSRAFAKIKFSIDGATQETYQVYRRTGDLNVCIQNMKKLVEARGKNKLPHLIWKLIVMKHNEHETEKARAMAEKIGIEFMLQKFVLSYWTVDRKLDYLVPSNPEWLRMPRKQLQPCSLWTREPFIRWNGDVYPCCVYIEPNPEYRMGNIFEADLREIWFGKRFMQWRNNVKAGLVEICNNCHR